MTRLTKLAEGFSSLNKLKIQLANRLSKDTNQMPPKNRSVKAQSHHRHCVFALSGFTVKSLLLKLLFSLFVFCLIWS